jgi:DNA-binding NarL/FixJ family response regulator
MTEKRPPIPPPPNLEAREMVVDGEELLVFEFPLPVLRHASVLTEVERDVALAAASGLSNIEIAEKRGRSPRTIAHQLDAIYRKLGVRSRIELARVLSRGDEPEPDEGSKAQK